MADLSKLSNDQLLALYKQTSAPKEAPKVDYSKLSDQELLSIYKQQKESAPAPTESFFRQAAGAGSLGYLPELSAGATRLAAPVVDFLTGSNYAKTIPGYTELRDQEQKKMDRDIQVNPKASIGGMLAGGAALTPAAALIPGASLIKTGKSIGQRAMGAVSVGSTLGALTNPGSTEGVIDPVQVGDRLLNTLVGGVTGVATQGLAEGAKVLSEGGKRLTKYAQQKSFQTTGAKLKDTEKALGKGQLEEIGKELLDEGLVRPGSTPATLAAELPDKLTEIGAPIGEQIVLASQSGQKVSLVEVANKLRGSVDIDKMAKTPGLEGSAKQINSMIDTLLENGDQIPLDQAWNLRKGIDKALSSAYQNKAFDNFKTAEEALLTLRNSIQDGINKGVEGASGIDLKPTLKKYSLLAEANRIAEKEAARGLSNRAISLTDTIAAVAGSGAGRAGIGASSGYYMGGTEGALAGAAVGAGANKLIRTFGRGTTAAVANKAGQLMSKLGGPTAPIVKNLLKVYDNNAEGFISAAQSVLNRGSSKTDALKRRMENK